MNETIFAVLYITTIVFAAFAWCVVLPMVGLFYIFGWLA